MSDVSKRLNAFEEAENNLNYMLVFFQETGEEAIVHDMTVADAIEEYPEWRYSHSEVVKDDAYYKYETAEREYRFALATEGMDEEEYEDYLDSQNDYDYELDDCFDY